MQKLKSKVKSQKGPRGRRQGAAKPLEKPQSKRPERPRENKNSSAKWSLSECALDLDVDVGQLKRESERAGFPRERLKSGWMYDVAAVREWRRHNVRPRRGIQEQGAAWARREQAAGAAWAEAPAVPAGAAEDGGVSAEKLALIETLKSGKATALEISRAAMQLASLCVAEGAEAGIFGFNDMENLKKALQELRQAEADYIELAKGRGELLERDLVKVIAGTMAARLVQCVVNLENAIATEFEVWLADPAIAAMPADERRRKVREFVGRTCNEVRRQEAGGAEKMIEETRTAQAEEEG